MKRTCLGLTVGMLLSWSTFVFAASFGVTEMYSSGRNNRHSYVTMNDQSGSGFSAVESLTAPVNPGNITSAYLDITFSGISTNARQSNELWSVLVATSLDNNPSSYNEFVPLGELISATRPNGLTTMTFALNDTLYEELSQSGSLYIIFQEGTRGRDRFRLLSCSLYGTYELPDDGPGQPVGPVTPIPDSSDSNPAPPVPVPEPSTMLLLCTGLVGAVGLGRKSRSGAAPHR